MSPVTEGIERILKEAKEGGMPPKMRMFRIMEVLKAAELNALTATSPHPTANVL